MNCLDFRREALAQPLRLSPESGEHVAQCAACTAMLERLREQDADLYDMMRIPAPDGLADRVLIAQGIRHRRRPWAWALAATVLLAIGATTLLRPHFSGRSLAGEAIAHVIAEPAALAGTATSGDLTKELAAQGIRLSQVLGRVTFAALCPFEKGNARHLVVNMPQGPVSLFLLNDGAARNRAVTEDRGMTAISRPAGKGSIAIVAATREQALAVERALVFS